MNICLLADARSVHIRQLSLHLSKRGARIHILTHKPARVAGATVERFAVPPPGLSNPRRWAARRRRYVLDLLRRFDVLNVHFLADWGLEGVIGERKHDDARLIATAWGSDIVDPPGETPATPELTESRKKLLRAADAVTTCGPTFAKTVAEYAAIPSKSISVVPFGVDFSLFKSGASKLEESDAVRIGFFKGFRPVYGSTVLVRAIPRILAECPQSRFELIGDGDELDECQALARELNVDHTLEWMGRMDHALLPRRLRRWHLSVIPSLHEAFGVAALESQAMGVPVVASRVDGLNDTVQDGRTGLLFPVGEADALARAVLRLLNDRGLRERLSDAGRNMVARHFDWGQVAGQWMDLYSHVCEQSCMMV